ncbi:mitochondrial thiamine pyrophosphate carrier-like [Uranotaenia lowii]|uniref:mitochondrial thiamine pyrophosphate carrier-like n=1 Tax=Uranotaenia lowii TaxID=190385 RepID=UPI002479BBAA|nr:mitochondrial thiamine pyrophosphate carrier-like [Uranotaenia lowii]
MDRKKNEQVHYAALCGGLTGCITRFVCQPLDVLKIRLQLQAEPISTYSAVSKYRSVPHAIACIYKEEGLLAFWKGHNPAQVLSLLYGVAQFSFYERFNGLLREVPYFEEHNRTRNFFCGAVSGTYAALVIMPLDVIRTRMVAQDSGRGYRNAFHAISEISRKEGVRGLYRGLGPAILQVAPLTGGQFMFYNMFGSVYRSFATLPDNSQLPPTALLVCGALAGLSTKLIVYPLDLAKKRLQIQGFAKDRQTFGKHFVCKGIFQCLFAVTTNEGFRSLYKGLIPTLLKAGATSAMYFPIYDMLLRFLNTNFPKR